MKLFAACLMAVALSFVIKPSCSLANDAEVVVSPDAWKAATEPASPGWKFRPVGNGGSEKGVNKDVTPKGGAQPVDIDDGDYDRVVEQSSLPVVIEFWSPGCVHCRNMAPTVDELASEMGGRVKVVKMNVNENIDIPSKYNVDGIPAFFHVRDGNVVGSAVGSMSKSQLKRELGL